MSFETRKQGPIHGNSPMSMRLWTGIYEAIWTSIPWCRWPWIPLQR